MSCLSSSAEKFRTVAELVAHCEQAMQAAGLHFGHGTDNAFDEACWLVAHALGLPADFDATVAGASISPAQRERALALLARRIEERVPLAYLTGEAWFAGLSFQVTPDVLIPRSPLAEMIEEGFAPWCDLADCRSLVDVGTGSGCIAIACAWHHPWLAVDALDISPASLHIAQANVNRHGLERRVRLWQSDLLTAVAGRRYDIIVSNPPYVPHRSMVQLPPEYGHEPPGALEAADHGLEIVLRLLKQAPDYLNPQGIVVVEVGEAREALEARLPACPFIWPEFARGGEGVFVLDAQACRAIEYSA